MLGLIRREKWTPQQYAEVYAAVKSANPRLKLWTVVYTHELGQQEWKDFMPYMDVVNLWVWEAADLPKLDEYINRCREFFPGKPINLGCYMRNYSTAAPVPMDMLKFQWERIPRYLNEDLIEGYSILAAVLIDGHQEQANWIREFIKRSS
jgi:hypothetical protein